MFKYLDTYGHTGQSTYGLNSIDEFMEILKVSLSPDLAAKVRQAGLGKYGNLRSTSKLIESFVVAGMEKEEEPEKVKAARKIMRKNFFGVEEAVKHFGVDPTRQQLAALSEIPFSEAVLDKSKDTHILVAVFPLSILEIRDKVDRKLFYNHEDAWYNEQPFAKVHGEVNWQLVRKIPADNSIPKDWQEQQALFGKDDEVPTAQVMVYTIIGHILTTGEHLVERKYAYTSSVDSRGNRVYVSDVGFDGIGISDYWDAVRYDNEDLSSPRKL